MAFDEMKANEANSAPLQPAPRVVALTRFPDIFARFRNSVDYHEYDAGKVVVTSGRADVNPAGWQVMEGVEPFIFARNVNLAFRAIRAERDILLANDDCELTMPVIETLRRICRDQPAIGLLLPQIDGGVANPAQRSEPGRANSTPPRSAWPSSASTFLRGPGGWWAK